MASGHERADDLEGKYDGYTVYDRDGNKIGKVDDLFVDENDREEYIGVTTGLFGLSGTTMIPVEVISVGESDRFIRVDESKERIKDAPNYSDQDNIDADYENRVRQHFGLSGSEGSSGRGAYGPYPDDEDAQRSEATSGRGDRAGTEGRSGGQSDTESRGGDRSDAESREMGREGSGEDRRGYREEGAASGASTGGAAENRESSRADVERTDDREGSRGEMDRGDDREGSTPGYRDSEAGDGGEGMGLTTRRRRVRRRSLREEDEEVFEQEDSQGRPS